MSRTNYMPFSQAFDNPAWHLNNVTVTPNAAIAPDGSTTADLISEISSPSVLFHSVQPAALAVITEPYTLSVYFKAAIRTQISLVLNVSTTFYYVTFETNTSTAAIVPSLTSGSIAGVMIYVGNGWWRLAVTSSSLPAGNLNAYYQIALLAQSAYVSGGVAAGYLWGAQLETGSVATPYIENDTGSPLTVSDSTSIVSSGATVPSGNVFTIPLQVGTPQTFDIQLGGTSYQLTLLYRNDTSGLGGWTVDIADGSGNPIVQGIPLVTGADLLAQYKYLGFMGALVAQTTSNPDAVPTFSNLGDDGQLYWVTT